MKHLKTLVTLFLLVIGTGMSWAEFKDFEIDLMHETVTLPDGVTATNDGQNGPYYNGGHGWANYVFALIAMVKCHVFMNQMVQRKLSMFCVVLIVITLRWRK